MKRSIIKINEAKCTGCGQCIPNCPEGAIQMIDGKARLVSDLFCDGLGACLGHCPESAIAVEEREAEPYDEARVMVNIVKAGRNTIKAHLEHLRDHHQTEYLAQALRFLEQKGLDNPLAAGGTESGPAQGGGCPGARLRQFRAGGEGTVDVGHTPRPSELTHWPVQLHLISPQAPHYAGSDLLLAADCTAYALGDFHKAYLKGRTLAIACPKLDVKQEVYVQKIKALIDEGRINTLTVVIMQVPCCGGLLRLARQAATESTRKVPVKCVVVGLEGVILKDEWL